MKGSERLKSVVRRGIAEWSIPVILLNELFVLTE